MHGYSFTSTNFLFLSMYHVFALSFFPSIFADLTSRTCHLSLLSLKYSLTTIQDPSDARAFVFIPIAAAIDSSPSTSAVEEFPELAAVE